MSALRALLKLDTENTAKTLSIQGRMQETLQNAKRLGPSKMDAGNVAKSLGYQEMGSLQTHQSLRS